VGKGFVCPRSLNSCWPYRHPPRRPFHSGLPLPILLRPIPVLLPFHSVAPIPAQARRPRPSLLHLNLNLSTRSPLALRRRLPLHPTRSPLLNPQLQKSPFLSQLQPNRPSPRSALGNLHLPSSPLLPPLQLRRRLRSQLRHLRLRTKMLPKSRPPFQAFLSEARVSSLRHRRRRQRLLLLLLNLRPLRLLPRSFLPHPLLCLRLSLAPFKRRQYYLPYPSRLILPQ
jgi:hypothetical protein